MSLSLDNKLVFIVTFQFLSSLDRLVKNVGKNGFKHLSQGLDSELLDLAKQRGFYPYKYMCDFEV